MSRDTTSAVEVALADARQGSDATVKRLRADLQRKDSLLTAAKAELQIEQTQLAEASAKLQAIAAKDASTSKSFEAPAGNAVAMQVMRACRVKTRLVLRCAAAMRAGAFREKALCASVQIAC